MTIKVLVVDDSKLIRNILSEVLNSDSEIEVIDTACDVKDAREKIKRLNPDVLTLDIEMPGMDGISFLEKIMTLRPMPVVMISTLTKRGAESTIKSLEFGAVDFISKPTEGLRLKQLSAEIITKVKTASKAKVKVINKKSSKNNSGSSVLPVPVGKASSKKIIVIGASTGGVEALKEVLVKLPKNMPPILVVQHMPARFTESFARRLNGLCQLDVCEAKDGQKILPGNVYIAAGDKHLTIEKQNIGGYSCSVRSGPKVSGHRPSVDVMFTSTSEVVDKGVLGVILTGMGRDGADGMLDLKRKGAFTIGQDEQSCVVYGMPKEAYLNDAVDIQLSLSSISKRIIDECYS